MTLYGNLKIKDAENTLETFGPGKGVENTIESYILETLSGIFLGVTGNWKLVDGWVEGTSRDNLKALKATLRDIFS